MPPTWGVVQEMMRQGVMPTKSTEKELAEAFSTSPDFANSVIKQSRRYRALLAASVRSLPAVCPRNRLLTLPSQQPPQCGGPANKAGRALSVVVWSAHNGAASLWRVRHPAMACSDCFVPWNVLLSLHLTANLLCHRCMSTTTNTCQSSTA